ncbi:MAG: hypothetical protein ACI4V5_05525 [Prevotella sp.]
MYKNLIVCIVLLCLTASCKKVSLDSEDRDIAEVAHSFASNYFGLNVVEARKYATYDSELWLRLYASNIAADDISMVNASEDDVSVEITDVERLSDTTAVVRCKVDNYLDIEDLCEKHHISDDGNFLFTLVRKGDKWLVRMEGLPQNERRSLD